MMAGAPAPSDGIVDPGFEKDPDTKDIHEITLSYTFYPVETVTASR